MMQHRPFYRFTIILFVLVTFSLISSVGASSVMWNQTYGGTDYDQAYSLVETFDGGFALVGETESFGSGFSDSWLVKTDEYGIIPEFPSWIILPLVIIATLVAIIYKKRLFNPRS